MIILLFKMLICMMHWRRAAFWWSAFWLIFNVSTLNSMEFVPFDIIARIVTFVGCVAVMVYEFYNELLYVRASKFRGPRF